MMQSMLFIKSAGKPGQAWHQDEAHIPTRDRSLTAVWIALDDATKPPVSVTTPTMPCPWRSPPAPAAHWSTTT
ncbi:MAG TPA: phytanoyl-CoA dioxygenase family protein [Actinophytocola sp.]|uniref:phytanoyl-CoA dioxygenase family protein n=1 Tax=Actinophytocola sp. TaxID=1872138 RepID=UPI002E000F26|nr:phytanoyl-CoA dioxygenase family protein [Actinophytocola sp.]